ncbi:hypothetical protein H8356DRAFT_937617 [Neocallimastix lanati (nom. inval.)]|nr:hypothetical protein H8356DRAFT_937617 [Neocallimastix sp. JGI-2020a]
MNNQNQQFRPPMMGSGQNSPYQQSMPFGSQVSQPQRMQSKYTYILQNIYWRYYKKYNLYIEINLKFLIIKSFNLKAHHC